MRLPKAVVDAVWERDLSRCFRCGTLLRRGRGGYSIHHRIPGGMGGSPATAHRLSNLILLCGSGVSLCHGWVESNREAAYGQGLLVRRPANPSVKPINRWYLEWVLLLDDGTISRRPY